MNKRGEQVERVRINGENDRAIDLLEKAYDERVERLVWLRADPRFDPLRLDPRFNDLLTRMGLAR